MTEGDIKSRGDFMEEARQIAAQCWCDEENAGKVMDVELAESMARRLSGWMMMLALSRKSADYYVGLLDECAKHIGTPAYTADDGTVGDSPIRAKLPELVKQLVHIMMRV